MGSLSNGEEGYTPNRSLLVEAVFIKEESTVPPMPSEARWSDAAVKEEGTIPPMPSNARWSATAAEEKEEAEAEAVEGGVVVAPTWWWHQPEEAEEEEGAGRRGGTTEEGSSSIWCDGALRSVVRDNEGRVTQVEGLHLTMVEASPQRCHS